MKDEAKPEAEDQGWECGWEEHRLAQMRRAAQWRLWEKLAWLEEAQRFAEFLSQDARRRIAEKRRADAKPRPVPPTNN